MVFREKFLPMPSKVELSDVYLNKSPGLFLQENSVNKNMKQSLQVHN
jgi:hypothetical protein